MNKSSSKPNIKEMLQQNKDGVYQCPDCGQFELRQMFITDGTITAYLDEFECDNPNCGINHDPDYLRELKDVDGAFIF